jgi:hypothetical protein
MPVVLLIVARRFRRDDRWRSYFTYTLATALFCLATIVFFLAFAGPPGTPPRFATPFMGLIQRVQLLPFFAWLALVALRAYRTTLAEAVPTHPSATSDPTDALLAGSPDEAFHPHAHGPRVERYRTG